MAEQEWHLNKVRRIMKDLNITKSASTLTDQSLNREMKHKYK